MSTRLAYTLGFVAICSILLTSVYLQVFQGFTPCPLCTLQRLTFGALGILFLIGIFAYKSRVSRIIINLFSFIMADVGLFLSGRQVWLQHFPSTDSSDCGVSLQYMLQALPLNEVFARILAGTAECTQRGFCFLYMDMAEWSLVCFTGFLILAIYLLKKN